MEEKIRILVDTNFFIDVDAGSGRRGLPTHHSLDQTSIDLVSLANRNDITLCLHKATEEDLLKGNDAASMIKKMKKYEIIGASLVPDNDYWKAFGSCSTPGTNNYRDDCILNALYKNAATYLVTRDRKMIRKATMLGIDDRVFTPEECLEFLKGFFEPEYKIFTELKEVELSAIPINQPIFDSLKADYDGFEDWYAKKARSGRKAWIIGDEHALQGIAIYDLSNKDCDDEMKICTFKVDQSARGSNLGELLMKQILDTAFRYKKEKLFVEIHPERDDLISWFEEFGFEKLKEITKTNGLQQLVMVKKMKPTEEDYKLYNPNKFLRNFYPYFPEPPTVTPYLVPIQPNFAKILFADSLPQKTISATNPIANRAIRKIYVSNSKIRKIKPGDLLFFYISGKDKDVPTQSILTVGVVDDTKVTNDVFELISFAGKRTVYTPEQISDFVLNGKTALAVKFWHLDRIKEAIPLNEIGITKGPQSFATMSIEVYNKIKDHKNFQ